MKKFQSLTWTVLIAGGLALSVVPGTVAHAQEKTGEAKAAPEPNPQAEAHYNAGVAAAQKREWEKACEEFALAFKIESNPQIAANLGHAELKAGRMRSAAEHLDYFLRNDREATPAAKAEIEELLKQAQKHIVTVEINMDQAGAEVLVEGALKGVSPLNKPIFLERGEYTFEVRKSGWKAEKQTRIFERGEKPTITMNMVADAGANVGPKRGTDKGQEPAWRTPLTVAFAGLAAVSIGTGMVTGIIRLNHSGLDGSADGFNKLIPKTRDDKKACGSNGYEGNKENCAELLKMAEQSEQLRKATIIGFSVGGAALVALMVTRFYPGAESSRTQLKPIVGSSITGLIISRDF